MRCTVSAQRLPINRIWVGSFVPQKQPRLDLQAVGDARDVVDGDIAFSTLDRAQIGSNDAALMPKPLRVIKSWGNIACWPAKIPGPADIPALKPYRKSAEKFPAGSMRDEILAEADRRIKAPAIGGR